MNLHVAVVIPYLNEEDSLGYACASLGFGIGNRCPNDAVLILVDNGSTDGSAASARSIAAASPTGCVHLTNESERGFVPPRHRGIIVAGQLAAENAIPLNKLLILQCDADTTYSPAYVDAMREVAEREEGMVLLQALTEYPQDFLSSYPHYEAYCDKVDRRYANLLIDHPEQMVVDDKATGYLLEHYRQWGGLQREWFSNGEEVDAETTRLYMRANGYGCRLVTVDSARSQHSVRKVLSQPALDLATAGFPRRGAWLRKWVERTAMFGEMGHFLSSAPRELIEEALDWRRKHTLALFGLLPVHIARTLQRTSRLDTCPDIPEANLPHRNVDTLRGTPAVLVEDVFRACQLISE